MRTLFWKCVCFVCSLARPCVFMLAIAQCEPAMHMHAHVHGHYVILVGQLYRVEDT